MQRLYPGRASDSLVHQYATHIATTESLDPQFLHHLYRLNATDPSFNARLSAETQRVSGLIQAKRDSTPLAIAGNMIEQMANPLEWVAGGARGVGELAHGRYLGGGLDVAGALPFFKPLRAGRALEEGLQAARVADEGERAAAGAKAAVDSWDANRGVLGPLFRRGVKNLGARTFKVGGLEATQARASSRIGRVVEAALDHNRDALAKAGLMNSTVEKAGRRAAADITARAHVGTSPGDALLTIIRRPAWIKSKGKDYALRILSEHSLPGNPISIADRQAFHLGRAEEADQAGDGLSAQYHRIHSHLIGKASKYLVEHPNGAIELAHDAPKDLKDAWRLLQKVAKGRESVYRDIGRLSDIQIANRIQAPGRVLLGARWMPDEKVVSKLLAENPSRAEFHRIIDETIHDPAEASAAKQIADASARSYAEAHAAEGNYDPVSAVDELFQHLKGASLEAPASEHLAQSLKTGLSHSDNLAQRAHTGAFGEPEHQSWGDLKGAYTPEGIIHLVQGKADLSTVIHEWGHFVRQNVLEGHTEDVAAKWSGASFDKQAGKWTWDTGAEEKFARGLEQWAREGNGPSPLKNVWNTAAKSLREIYDHAELPDVSPQMRQVFDRLFSFEKQKGGRLLGADDFHYGVNYAPYTRGAPVALSREAQVFGAYIRHRLQLFNPGKASAIGAGPDDVTLRKEFMGALLRSGNFKADVARASVRSLHTAWRLQSAKMARDALLQAGEDLPKDSTWIAIKVDPAQNLSEDVKRYWDRIHSVEGDGTKMSVKDIGELEHADERSVDEFIRELFPAEIDGVRTEHLAQQLAARAGDEMSTLHEPIDNIKWIPKELLDATGLTQIPAVSKLALRGLTKQQRIASTSIGLAFDAFNDVQRAGLLILSPSYIPVNLLGNVAMNVMHQGPLAFPNLVRSIFLHRELELEDRVAIDKLMGHGIMESVLDLKLGPGQILNHTIGHWSGVIVDLAPRRAAFLHEARLAGYRSPDQLRSLLHDPANTQDLVRVRDKATEAIVDYERLSPFEKNVVSRAIFVYPWIKGATHYSIRFAANHPIETMALALMADRAVDNANSELGPRPFYAQLEIPVSTKSLGFDIPGTNLGAGLDDLVGVHELKGKNGLPYTINPKQLLTQTTPYELGASILGTGGVSGLESLAGNFNPGLTTMAQWIAGYDTNTHKNVAQNLGGLVGLMRENFAAINKVKAINEADPSNQKKLFPRSRNEAIESLFLSGLAPKPFNKAKAAALAAGTPPSQTPVQKAQAWVTTTEKALGQKLPQQVINARNSKATYETLEKVAEKKTVSGKLTDKQRAEIMVQVLVQVHPQYTSYATQLQKAINADPSAIQKAVEKILGWEEITRLDTAVNKIKKAQKAQRVRVKARG